MEMQMREVASEHTRTTRSTEKKIMITRRKRVEMKRFTVTNPESVVRCINPPCGAPFTPPNNRQRTRIKYCCARCRNDHFGYMFPRVPREDMELVERIKKGELKVVSAESAEGAL